MRYYYFHDGEHQSGPFDISEIEPNSLKPDAAVWYAGLEYWIWAKQVEELKDFIKKSEEPVIKQPPVFYKEKIKPEPIVIFGKRQLKLVGFAILFIATFVATLSFITNVTKKTGVRYGSVNHAGIKIKKVEKRSKPVALTTAKKEVNIVSTKTNKEAAKERERVITMEKRDAAKFLVLDAIVKPSLWGSKIAITASITNIARLTKYKDVLIEITYYNQRKQSISSSKDVAYIELSPGESATVNLKATMPAGGKTASCRILTAIHYY